MYIERKITNSGSLLRNTSSSDIPFIPVYLQTIKNDAIYPELQLNRNESSIGAVNMVTEVLLKVPACSTFLLTYKKNQAKLKLPLIESNRLCKNCRFALEE